MHSATSSEGPRLVRIAVPYAQTMAAIELEMHSRTNGAKCCAFQEACSAGQPRVKQEMRSVLCHSLVVDSTERERHHCNGEFEQLLFMLTSIEGCGL